LRFGHRTVDTTQRRSYLPACLGEATREIIESLPLGARGRALVVPGIGRADSPDSPDRL